MKLVNVKFPRFLAGILLVLLATLAGVGSAEAQQASGQDLVRKLQAGGFNIYVRHAATDWSQNDKISTLADTSSCDGTKVRQLSAKGRADAKATGDALQALGVAFGKVYSSPYCRSAETARLMTGKEPDLTEDLMNLRSAHYVGGRDAVVARTRALLSRKAGEGLNALFAAHGNLGKAATGEYLAEGELLIVAPLGQGRFEIAGRIKLLELERLAER